ncbi:MAG: glycosyltransferase [Asticcacaulis sp.]
MPGLRHLPLKYRLPLIHGALWRLAQWRSRRWPVASSDLDARPGPLIVSGLLNEPLGVGQGGRLTLQALIDAGYNAEAHDLRPAFRRILKQDAIRPEGNSGVWLIHANPSEALVALLAHPPQSWAHTYRIGYWAWETSKAPRSWVFVAGFFHEIWVPSHFVRDAIVRTFAEAGRDDLIRRVRVMPHPLPPMPAMTPERKAQARRRFGLGEACEALCLFDAKSSAVRKNPWGVIDAWERAFPEASGEARLTIKIADADQDLAAAEQLRQRVAERSDMRLVSAHYPAHEMTAFVGAFDILISLHRAEGFGLTLAEAMAQGVAVIATGWSGNLQFMTRDNSRLIPATVVPVSDPEGPYTAVSGRPGQGWAEPHLWPAAHALRELVMSKAVREQIGQAARAAIPLLREPWRQAALLDMPFNAFL